MILKSCQQETFLTLYSPWMDVKDYLSYDEWKDLKLF